MSLGQNETSGAFSDEQVRDAVVAVATEHPADCHCDICKAASGDLLAFVRVCEGKETCVRVKRWGDHA